MEQCIKYEKDGSIKLKPKFKQQDTVYFMHNDRICHGSVCCTKVHISSRWGLQMHNDPNNTDNEIYWSYDVCLDSFRESKVEDLCESDLYKTKAQLIKDISGNDD